MTENLNHIPFTSDEREREVSYYFDVPFLNEPHTEVSVYYTKGGSNYFTGGVSQRGYYLSVRAVAKSEFGIRFSLMGAGLKQLILPAKRFNKKDFAEVVEFQLDWQHPDVEHLISATKEKYA